MTQLPPVASPWMVPPSVAPSSVVKVSVRAATGVAPGVAARGVVAVGVAGGAVGMVGVGWATMVVAVGGGAVVGGARSSRSARPWPWPLHATSSIEDEREPGTAPHSLPFSPLDATELPLPV
ncbi:MAG: hypothetical protein U0841_02290 [Chloroflexia bacterium]